jgi:transposase
MTQLTIKNPDHLGIIAAIVDEISIIDYINQQLGEKDTTKISAGLVVKALILNGLGFINSPLYLFRVPRKIERFYKNRVGAGKEALT